MCSPNQLLLLAIATLLYAQYSEAAKITPPQRSVVKAKALNAFTITQASTTLKEAAVTAIRSETAVNDIPANITTLDRRTLDRRLPRDEADLFRDEPHVVVARDLHRFVSAAFNIRGLKNVRLPVFYNGDPPTSQCQARNSSCPTLSNQY